MEGHMLEEDLEEDIWKGIWNDMEHDEEESNDESSLEEKMVQGLEDIYLFMKPRRHDPLYGCNSSSAVAILE